MENSLLNAVLWHRKVGTSIHLVMVFLQQRLYLAKNIKSFLTEEILIQYFGGLQKYFFHIGHKREMNVD